MISEDEELKIDFYIAALEATKKCLQAEFICPICGGVAYVSKSACNNHRNGTCSKCNIRLIQ